MAATGGGHELNPALLQQQQHHHHAPRSLLLFSMREGPAIAGGASAVGAAACYPRGSPWSPPFYRVAGGVSYGSNATSAVRMCDDRNMPHSGAGLTRASLKFITSVDECDEFSGPPIRTPIRTGEVDHVRPVER